MAGLSAELKPHPAQTMDAVRGIAAAAEAGRGTLRLRFRLEGEVARLLLPEPADARRRDGLWQHSCFEAFLRPDASDSYHEFNFSPSGEWAAYRFAARREGRTVPELPAPAIAFAAHAEGCELNAEIHLAAIPELACTPALAVGLAAVVEQAGGMLSHWALAHGGVAPDFHDPASFRLRLVPA
jgi:hypothetical protein